MSAGFCYVEGWGPSEGWPTDVTGVAVDDWDRVHVLQRSYPQVTVLDPNGNVVGHWGHPEISTRPHFITICEQRAVIADDGGHRIFVFDLDGTLIVIVGDGRPSASGYQVSETRPQAVALLELTASGPFNRPTKGAFLGDKLYVTDGYRNCRLHHFSDDMKLVHSWGAAGSAQGEFVVPHSLLVDEAKRILVCDRENDRVQIFSPDGENVGMWENVQRPTDLAVDRQGFFYLTELPRGPNDLPSFRLGPAQEQLKGRVTKRDANGAVVDEVLCDGVEFLAPHAVAVDRGGAVYVSEVPQSFGGYNGTDLSLDACLRKFEPNR